MESIESKEVGDHTKALVAKFLKEMGIEYTEGNIMVPENKNPRNRKQHVMESIFATLEKIEYTDHKDHDAGHLKQDFRRALLRFLENEVQEQTSNTYRENTARIVRLLAQSNIRKR